MVMRDASLAAQVLHTANAARFAGGREVTDVLRATVRMGQDSIRRLAITLGMRQGLKGGPAGDLHKVLLEHATATALIAQTLSSKQTEWDPAVCYTGGLLRNMGALGLASWSPERFETIREASKSNEFDARTWETTQFGISRETVGEWLAVEWGLPQEFKAVMAGDAHQDGRIELLIRLIDAAGSVATSYGLGVEAPEPERSAAEILERAGLDPTLADDLPETAAELLENPVL